MSEAATSDASDSGEPQPFGSLDQYRIIVDELKAHHAGWLQDEAYETLLAIHFELPFQVPWGPEPFSHLVGDTFISFRLRPERRQIQSHFGAPATYAVTSVTTATPANRFPELDKDKMSDVFDWMLEGLNTFLTAYSLVTKDGGIGPVTLPMLSPLAVWGFIKPYQQTATVEGLFLINPRSVLYEKEPPPENIGREIIKFNLAMTTTGYPFLTSWQLRIEGEQHLWKGRYHVAAILLAGAFETRANELLRYFFWKDGQSEEEFNLVLERNPFLKRLRTEFHPRIGGNFDTGKRGQIQDWHRFTHSLRNRVIHGGYRPTREETAKAHDAMVRAWDYIMALTRARSQQFPELAPYLALRGDQFFWPPRQTENKQPADHE